MRYFLLIVLLLTACGQDTNTNDRTDTNRPCYDECDRNADCMDGLVCSEWAGHVCVPTRCIECWAVQDRVCVVDEEYFDGIEYPLCTFNHCEG